MFTINQLVRLPRRMMMLGFLFLVTPAVATATTIDFNSDRTRIWTAGETYFEDGYALFFDSNEPGAIFNQGRTNNCSPTCPDNGTIAMISLGGNSTHTMTLTRVGGGVFSLLSFDGAESYSQNPNRWASAIRANGADFILDQINDGAGGLPDFQTFAAGLINVNSVVFSGLANDSDAREFTIDNLVIEEATAVPDNSRTLPLFALGLLALALSAKAVA